MRFRNLAGRTCSVLLGLLCAASGVLSAQESGKVRAGSEVFVGSELEDYLRWMQVAGKSEFYPWSVRGLSPREVDRLAPADSAHPWAGHYELRTSGGSGLQVSLVRPETRVIFNSAFPYGANDGPLWAGKGITTAVQAGFSARFGPVSLVVAPIAFHAQNAAFDLLPIAGDSVVRSPFGDPRNGHAIDLPQRFGEGAYARIDPGESTLRVDLPVVTAGISTASQHWGPAAHNPILLGNNAPGYLHGFAGSSSPLNVLVGRAHGRMVWGKLDQSPYSPVPGDLRSADRFMAGIVATFIPRGAEGLEIGGGRFFHTPWPLGGLQWGHFLKPFEGFLKIHLDTTGFGDDSVSDIGNQLASVYARWVLPKSGLELYGEYGRDDHSKDLRDVALEPDHASGFMLGFRKLLTRSDSRILALHGEVLNLEVSHLQRVRFQAPFYTHAAGTRQGHTQRGQLLGAASGYGGGGSVLGVDYIHPTGRWSATWSRQLRQSGGDVMHGVELQGLLFHGPVDLTAGVTGVYSFNRDMLADRFNLNTDLSVRIAF